MIPSRAGYPDPADVAGQYRLHADRIANGELPRPSRAIVIEFDADGALAVTAFGPAMDRSAIADALSRAAGEPVRLPPGAP